MSSRPTSKTTAAAEIDTSKYDMCDLADLKAKREAEIAELNFEEVAVIDAAIAKFNSENTQEVIDNLKKSLGELIDKAFEEYEAAIREKADATEKSEQEIKEKAGRSRQELEGSHQSAVDHLKEKTQGSLDREKKRPSAKAEELKSRAKLLARNHEVQRAIELRELAKAQLEDDIAQREFEVTQSYERKMRHLEGKQTTALEDLEEKFEKYLQSTKDGQDNFGRQQRVRVVQIMREGLRKEIAKGCRLLKSKSKWPLVSQELSTFVQTKLVEEKKDFIFKGA